MSTPVRYFGKYELRERLGQGGMAEVWKAFDPQLKRFVAIKYLHANMQADPHILTRFTGEAQTIALLRHPNIIHIYEFAISDPDSDNPTPYMVMDYIEGKTLKDYIDSTSRIIYQEIRWASLFWVTSVYSKCWAQLQARSLAF